MIIISSQYQIVYTLPTERGATGKVACLAVETCPKGADSTGCSAIRTLLTHALRAIAGCEAVGIMYRDRPVGGRFAG